MNKYFFSGIIILLLSNCSEDKIADDTPKHPNAEYIGYWEMVEASYEGTPVTCGQIFTTSTGTKVGITTFNLELKDSTEYSYQYWLCRQPTDTISKWWIDDSNTTLGLRMILEFTDGDDNRYKFKYVSGCIYLSTWDSHGLDRLVMKFQRR